MLAAAAGGAGAPMVAGAGGVGWLIRAGSVAGAARPLSGIGDIGADCQSRPKTTLPSTTIRTAR